jgi:transposase
MKNYQYFIGIDVSKNELDFALIESNKVLFHLEVSNDQKGIEQFIRQIKNQYKGFSIENSLFCMEHTARAAPRYL